MKTMSIIALAAAAIFVAGIMTAGCIQDTGSSSPATSDQGPAGAGNTPPAGDGMGSGNAYGTPYGNGSYAGHSGAGGNHTFRGQGFASNTTLLNAAAAKLGVSTTDLQAALNGTPGSRPNLTDAAQQLGVTPQQLMDALGFPAGGFHSRPMTSAAAPSNP